MRLPQLTELPSVKDNTEEFLGYNHNLRTQTGEWFDQQNMTTDFYPVASPRGKRSKQIEIAPHTFGRGGFSIGDCLGIYYSDGTMKALQEVGWSDSPQGAWFTNNGEVVAGEDAIGKYELENVSITGLTPITEPQTIYRGAISNLDIPSSAFSAYDWLDFRFHTTVQGKSVWITASCYVESYTAGTLTLRYWNYGTQTYDKAEIINYTGIRRFVGQYASYFAANTTQRQLVRMGSYICVFPDGVVYETASSADVPVYKIAAESSFDADESHTLTFRTVIDDETSESGYTALDIDGTTYRHNDGAIQYYIDDKALWVNEPTKVMIFSTTDSNPFGKYRIGDVLNLNISCGCIPYTATPGDNDTLSYGNFDGLFKYSRGFTANSIKIIDKGSAAIVDNDNTVYDFIVVEGFMYAEYENTTPTGEYTIEAGTTDTAGMTVTAKRKYPSVKFACESQNRIWCCSEDGHEIYASALGNPYNYYDYSGISTDSYAVNVGTDGEFTGCVNFLGQPLFFKENALHHISGSYPTNSGEFDGMSYNVTTATDFKGVEKGSERSLAIIDNILYYKSAAGIVAYDGATTRVISSALGKEKYKNAVAGVYKNKYYVSMEDSSGEWHLFVYDTALGAWSREDNTHILQFITIGNELLYSNADDDYIRSVSDEDVLNLEDYEKEGDIEWECETAEFGYSYPNHKYLSRFQIRAKIPDGARAAFYIQYDSNGRWEKKGELNGRGTRTHLFPIVPVRCDHMKLKIKGKGDVKIYSIAKILEEGGDA